MSGEKENKFMVQQVDRFANGVVRLHGEIKEIDRIDGAEPAVR